jgi:polyisoprenoid-binding protein YceI
MQWNIDTAHSSIDFAVKHLGISTVRGRFRQFSGVIDLDQGGELQGVEATIVSTSIDTGVEQRDKHLRSADFFEAETYPTITFRSHNVESLEEGRYRVTGNLTMHGQTHPVALDVVTASPVTDPWGNQRAAATVSGTLNRKLWGLTWNQLLEFGAAAVGEEVRFIIDVEAVAQQPVRAAA